MVSMSLFLMLAVLAGMALAGALVWLGFYMGRQIVERPVQLLPDVSKPQPTEEVDPLAEYEQEW